MSEQYKELLKKKEKEWNCPDLMNNLHNTEADKLPFSSPLMNWCTYGGIPRNKITEFFGDPGGGKTTTAVDICKNAISVFKNEYDAKMAELRKALSKGDKSAQNRIDDLKEQGRKRVLYIDLEHSFDVNWCETLGIKQDEIDIMQPPDVTAESILQMVLDLIETNDLGLIVLDSIPSLTPQAVLDKQLGEKTVASLAGLLTTFCTKAVPLLTRYNCTLLVINQTRDNLENPYVVKTPGGRALKFYCTLRINFRVGSPVDFLGNELPQKTENPDGYLITAQIVKQKSAPWDRKLGKYYLMCQSGIRPDFDYAKLAIERYDIIHKAGAWFTICDTKTGEALIDENGKTVKVNGLAKVYDYLSNNPKYYKELQDYIMENINQNG